MLDVFCMAMETNLTRPSFKARCASIKDAQMVYRVIRKQIPYVAHSKAVREASTELMHKKNIWDYLVRRTQTLLEYREDRAFLNNNFNFYKEILCCAFKEKIAVCYELSALTELVLRLNNIQRCAKASLVSKSGQKLNHCVTCVQLSAVFDPKKTIIIDSFLQDADFLPNMLTKYKNEYKRYLNKIDSCDDIMLDWKKECPLTENNYAYFKEKYPDLIINRQLFTDKNS